jgi:acyl-CoA synthetase (NDP forming)
MFNDPKTHGIILLGLHHMPGLQEKYISGTVEVARKYNKPIVAVDIGETDLAIYTRSHFDRLGVPSFDSPEAAARAMKALVWYGEYLKKNGGLETYIANYKKAVASKP